MIAAIRIAGMVNMDSKVEETFFRLRLRKKYCCVLIAEDSDKFQMMKKVRNFIAYGKINEETLKKLIEKRGKKPGNKPIKDVDKIFKELIANKYIEPSELKPFFSLHPPRGGIKSKLHYPKGVLGDNKEGINKLIERML